MSYEFNMAEMPEDLKEYWHIMAVTGGTMGLKMYQRCQEIINANPKYFPWEHKYKLVPQEVHDAYKKETDINWDKLFDAIPKEDFGGLIPTLMSKPNVIEVDLNKEISLVDMMKDLFNTQEENRKKKIAQWENDKSIWDKYYKKYKLEYREPHPFSLFK